MSFGHFAAASEGYSGSDLRLLCKEAAMRPVRRMMADVALGQAQGDKQPPQVSVERRLAPPSAISSDALHPAVAQRTPMCRVAAPADPCVFGLRRRGCSWAW